MVLAIGFLLMRKMLINTQMILNQSKNIKFNKTNTETWKVYFLIDNNKVVYIGCTNNIIKRLDQIERRYNEDYKFTLTRAKLITFIEDNDIR